MSCCLFVSGQQRSACWMLCASWQLSLAAPSLPALWASLTPSPFCCPSRRWCAVAWWPSGCQTQDKKSSSELCEAWSRGVEAETYPTHVQSLLTLTSGYTRERRQERQEWRQRRCSCQSQALVSSFEPISNVQVWEVGLWGTYFSYQVWPFSNFTNSLRHWSYWSFNKDDENEGWW